MSFHGGEVKYEINRDDNPIYNQLVAILDSDQLKLLNAYLDKVEEFIPKGLIVTDNADSLKILNSEEQLEEDQLVDEVIDFAKHSLNPENCVELLLQSQAYSKIQNRKSEILEAIKDGKK